MDRKQADKTRTVLQEEALDVLRRHGRLILNWGTGVGKSRVAVRAAEGIINRNPDARILLMVQETPHKDNWRTEFNNTLGKDSERILKNVTMDCYASLHKHRNSAWDLIVFDEGHHLRSAIRQEIVSSMTATRVLVLTATASDGNDGDQMLQTLDMTFGHFESRTFALKQAIRSKVLGEPEIHVIPVVLNKKHRDKYDSLSDYQTSKSTEYFRLRRETGLGPDDPETEETEEAKAKWLNAGARRKRFLGDCKTRVAGNILRNQLKDSRYICFCSSVDQISWLGGKSHVSSRNTPKQNRETIEAFNNGDTDYLFAMGMLQEGQNLAGIEAGLLVQLDGKARPFIQKFGRVLRSETPVLYILYAWNTHDETYLENALAGIEERFIHHHEPVDMITAEKCRLPRTDTTCAPARDDVPAQVWKVLQDEGVFVTTGDRTTHDITGFIEGVDADGTSYAIRLRDAASGILNVVEVNKKLSLAIVASLSGLTKPKTKPLTVSVNSDGKWARYELFHGAIKLRWDRKVTDGYPSDSNEKVRYLDSVVDAINEKINN